MWKLLSSQQPQLINHLWDNSLRYQVTPGPILPSLDKKLCSALQAEQFAVLKCSGFLCHPLFPKPGSRLLPGKIIEPTPTFQEMFICLLASNDEEEAPPPAEWLEGNSQLTPLIMVSFSLPSSSVWSFLLPLCLQGGTWGSKSIGEWLQVQQLTTSRPRLEILAPETKSGTCLWGLATKRHSAWPGCPSEMSSALS